MDTAAFLAFLPILTLVVIFPGPNTVLIASCAARSRNEGMKAVLGVVVSLYVHALFSSMGLSAILAVSSTAYSAVKILGALWLICLGLAEIYGAFRTDASKAKSVSENSFRSGVLSTILNPKVAVFYLAVVPQYAGSSPVSGSFALCAAHSLISLVWYTFLVFGVHAAGLMFRRSGLRKTLKAAGGLLLAGFGLKAAFE
jgi:threonine/homoserine/homoserine lactone efflux protein